MAGEERVRQPEAFLRDVWYFALPGRLLKPGRMVAKSLVGEPLLFTRDDAGRPRALVDICPHRGMPLSAGRLGGGEIACSYHGWSFSLDGVCRSMPCLSAEAPIDPGRLRVRTYPCAEVQGNVWIFAGAAADAALSEPPRVPEVGDGPARIRGTITYPCSMDQAVFGLVDPAHGPYVHGSWFWRSPDKKREKKRSFAPSELGFTMLRHTPSSNSWIFRRLGRNPEIEISFQLPGLHVESVRLGDERMGGFITATPVSELETEINYQIWWSQRWLVPFTPVLKPFVHTFFRQDRRAMRALQSRAAWRPRQTFVGDADTQARWYLKLKREHERARAAGRPFRNPLREQTLSWRT